MRSTAALLSLLCLSASAVPAAEPPFVAVLVDAKAEAALGRFPLARKHYAQALKAMRQAGAKGVVIKDFLHEPGDAAGDLELAKELALIPSFLQARIDESTESPNPFPERFLVKDFSGLFSGTLSGSSGWLPLPLFAKAAAGVGFSDLGDPNRPHQVPLVELYQGHVSPTLYLSVIQWLAGPAKVVDGTSLTIGTATLTLDEGNETGVFLPPHGRVDYIPFLDLVKGRVPAKKLKGKVVVLGYDGPHQTTFQTPTGELGAHRVFYFALTDLYDRLAPAKR